MSVRTLVLRNHGPLDEPREAERLLKRLAAQPGVEWVRVDAAALCVSLRIVPEIADEPALRAMARTLRSRALRATFEVGVGKIGGGGW